MVTFSLASTTFHTSRWAYTFSHTYTTTALFTASPHIYSVCRHTAPQWRRNRGFRLFNEPGPRAPGARVWWPKKQEAFEKCWAHSPLRAAARPNFTLTFTRCRYYRTPPLSHAACASMSTTTTTTTRDRGDRYGPIEWAQLHMKSIKTLGFCGLHCFPDPVAGPRASKPHLLSALRASSFSHWVPVEGIEAPLRALGSPEPSEPCYATAAPYVTTFMLCSTRKLM